MHVGWAATFTPPDDTPRPRFDDLLDHIAGRIARAPRYRQRLAPVPLGVHEPEWVDDPGFDPAAHIRRSDARDLNALAGDVLSRPLDRDRPLWELWIADELGDGRIGMVGKAHHCMVDGIAAVELSTVLLDPIPHADMDTSDGRRADPEPAPPALLARGLADRAREPLDLPRAPRRAGASPSCGRRSGWPPRPGGCSTCRVAPCGRSGRWGTRSSPHRRP